MTDQLQRTGANNLGAFYSFLRVLATNVSTALLPLFIAKQGDEAEYPTVTALVIATVVSVLLTVANYFRSGETRFGTTRPNIVRAEPEGGAFSLGYLGQALVLIGVVLLVLALITSIGFYPGIVFIAVGLVLVVVAGSSR